MNNDEGRALREAAGFTQEELATIAGLSVHAVSSLERELSGPSLPLPPTPLLGREPRWRRGGNGSPICETGT
jgi:hypothetical protein